MANRTGVYIGENIRRYGFLEGHPFGVDRHDSFWNEAVRSGLDKQVEVLTPVRCSEEDLARFHDQEYIEFLKRKSAEGTGYLDEGDTPVFPDVFNVSSYIVGSDLDAIDRMMQGEFTRIFVPIAGLHHATPRSAAGFCTISDLGVVIKTLRERYGIKKIAYVDIDAHHGDGVFYAFESDPDLIFADIHEDGRFLYPGTGFSYETGKGDAVDTKLNIPVMPNSDNEVFFESWGRLEEFVKSFEPEFIVFQAGADSIKGDPLTHMEFTPEAHGYACRRLCKIADEYCNGRILATGGGGYNLRNLALGWCEVVRSLVETA